MTGTKVTALAAMLLFTSMSPLFAGEGNAARGQRVFGACAACHSLQPNQNMTGPSLAKLWDRKAGSLPAKLRPLFFCSEILKHCMERQDTR